VRCARGAAGAGGRGAARPARRPGPARGLRRRARDLRPRPRARPGVLHRCGVRRLRPGARRAAGGRRALRRPARALRTRAAGGGLRNRRGPPARGARRGGAVNRFGLTFAVPRGALLGETLDALERIGVDAGEVRSNDRRLLFADVGIVTMRPSDVPTYVEAGAADIGVTGKDVLMEQSERQVFELLDLGFGPCTMVLASRDGDDAAAEALRRLGVM